MFANRAWFIVVADHLSDQCFQRVADRVGLAGGPQLFCELRQIVDQ
jgi:hypothetical protein